MQFHQRSGCVQGIWLALVLTFPWLLSLPRPAIARLSIAPARPGNPSTQTGQTACRFAPLHCSSVRTMQQQNEFPAPARLPAVQRLPVGRSFAPRAGHPLTGQSCFAPVKGNRHGLSRFSRLSRFGTFRASSRFPAFPTLSIEEWETGREPGRLNSGLIKCPITNPPSCLDNLFPPIRLWHLLRASFGVSHRWASARKLLKRLHRS